MPLTSTVARRDRLQIGDDAQEGRLAAARRTDERDELARRDGQVDLAQGVHRRVDRRIDDADAARGDGELARGQCDRRGMQRSIGSVHQGDSGPEKLGRMVSSLWARASQLHARPGLRANPVFTWHGGCVRSPWLLTKWSAFARSPGRKRCMAETTSLSPDGGPDIRANRRDAAAYAAAFADAAPRFSRTQALVEAERCLYCYDAPCVEACPTGIDMPSFIRRIGEDNLRGAARTILDANPLGGTCARVCPTEELCEQVCVRGRAARQAGRDRPAAALCHRCGDGSPVSAALHARRGDRPAHRHRRRRPGRPGVRLRPGSPRPRGRDPRCPAARRRSQRIRPGDVQDGRRLRPGGGRLAARRSAASRSSWAGASTAAPARRAARALRRGLSRASA